MWINTLQVLMIIYSQEPSHIMVIQKKQKENSIVLRILNPKKEINLRNFILLVVKMTNSMPSRLKSMEFICNELIFT